MSKHSDLPPPYSPVDPYTQPATQRPPAPTPNANPVYPSPHMTQPPLNTYQSFSSQGSSPHTPVPTQADFQPQLPWTYPQGYHCIKCNNTGYKAKNHKRCKRCWDAFGPRSTVPVVQVAAPNPGFRIPFTDYTIHDDLTVTNGNSPQVYPAAWYPHGQVVPPRVVQPGDPSLGGILCWKCKGRGVKRVMLIDEETCHVCHGVGRIIR